MNYYAVVFDRTSISSTNIPLSSLAQNSTNYVGFHNDFIKPQQIIKWWHYLESMYIICTEWSSKELSEHLIRTAQAHAIPMSHIVLEVDLSSRYGRLNKDAWEWIDNEVRTLRNKNI